MKNWKRSGKFNRHHIKAKSQGGSTKPNNIAIMDTRRHQAYHLLFGNLSFREAAALLLRLCEIKGQKDQEMIVFYDNKLWEADIPFELYESFKVSSPEALVMLEELTPSMYKERKKVAIKYIEDYSVAGNKNALNRR